MFPYFFIIISFFILKLLSLLSEEVVGSDKKIKSDYFYYIFIIIIFCFSAFRLGVGWDYYQYYWTIVSNLETNILGRGELATIALVKFSSQTGLTNLYFFMNSFITIILIAITINKYSVNKWISILIFISFPLFFLNSFSVIRFFTALSLVFFAFRYIESKSIFKYIVVVYIASMFHNSALMAIPLYFINYLNLNIFRILLLCGLSILFSSFINTFVLKYFPEYSVYTEKTDVKEGTLAIYFFMIVLISCLPILRKLNSDRVSKLYFGCFLFGFLIYISFYGQGSMSHRLSLFGTIFVLLLIPKIFNLYFSNNIKYIVIYFILYSLFSFMFFYSIYIGAETYVPYKTIFSSKTIL